MFWVNTVFTTTLPLLRIFRQIKPFTEHQYGIIKCPLCIVLYGLRTTPLFLSLPLTHTLAHAWLVHHMWAEVWALRRLLYDDSRWDLLIPSPMGLCKPLCNIRQKTLNQSVESAQCVCLTSPCSCHQWPGAGRHVSLPYPRCPITPLSVHRAWPLSQRQPHMHAQEGPFFIHLNTHRENQTSQIVPLKQLFYSWLRLRAVFPHSHLNIYLQ